MCPARSLKLKCSLILSILAEGRCQDAYKWEKYFERSQKRNKKQSFHRNVLVKPFSSRYFFHFVSFKSVAPCRGHPRLRRSWLTPLMTCCKRLRSRQSVTGRSETWKWNWIAKFGHKFWIHKIENDPIDCPILQVPH